MKAVSELLIGALFGLGLVLAGMTDPAKVQGFLDFFGRWDPTLMFVMGGAILVHAVGYRLVIGRERPIFGLSFRIPKRRDLDPRLIGGAALFGLGWGLGGFCPGPGITSLPTLGRDALLFVAAMATGMELVRRFSSKSAPLPAQDARPAHESQPALSEELTEDTLAF